MCIRDSCYVSCERVFRPDLEGKPVVVLSNNDGDVYKRQVHEGEFVANHAAVNNPQLLPALRLIDMAQRNNTVGSLTALDLSLSLIHICIMERDCTYLFRQVCAVVSAQNVWY